MLELPEVSLDAALNALSSSGYPAWIADVPVYGNHTRTRPAVWVGMSDPDTHLVVSMVAVIPGQRPGTWQRLLHEGLERAVVGYQVALYEPDSDPHRRRFVDEVGAFHSVFLDDVVTAVHDMSRWEATWAVDPVVDPDGKRPAYLRRLARSKLDTRAIPVDVDIDPLVAGMLDRTQAAELRRALDQLFLPGIRWRFPRGKPGTRLVTRQRVLLREFAPPSHPNARGLWLVVDGPEPRAEPRLTVRLADVLGKASRDRWDTMPEYWRRGPRSVTELWGISDAVTEAFVSDTTDDLLAGRIEGALVRCGIELDRGTRRLLAGLPDNFVQREWTDTWVGNAVDVLAGSAPWRWRDAVAPGRRPHSLARLGGPTAHERPGLFLHRRGDPVRVTFEQNATYLAVPHVAWLRDVDYDLVRAGLIAVDQIPMPA